MKVITKNGRKLVRVREHPRKSKKGKIYRVRSHDRITGGKTKCLIPPPKSKPLSMPPTHRMFDIFMSENNELKSVDEREFLRESLG